MVKKHSKKIVVTGVTRGLGYAMACGFAQAGHLVLGCGRSTAKVHSLRLTLGDPHDIAVVDVSSDKQVDGWAERLIAQHGAPDLLINNAAIINRLAPLWETNAEELAEIVEINIQGVVNVIRRFVPAMIEAQYGIIVNFSSGWGRSTSAHVAPYCATKWAIEGLTLALAQELPKGVAAIALNPGIIDTEMLRSCWGKEAGEYPSAEQWAQRAVPYLLSLTRRDNGKQLGIH